MPFHPAPQTAGISRSARHPGGTRHVLATALSLALSSLAWTTHAQENTATGNSAMANNTLAEITVTARQHAERIKDAPYSLTVFDGETIDTRRMVDLESVLRSTPGVSVNSSGGPNDYNLYVRGIGSLYQMSMDDSSVGLNIDGIAMSSRYLSFGTLDVERVEVLKGPQGTNSGGSAVAGAVNVITRKPTRTLEGYVRAEVGQDGQHLEEAAIGGPLSARLSGRFAIRNSGSEHWVDNSQNGEPISKPRDLAFRGSLLWDIAPGTSALFTAERQDVKRKANLLVLRPYADTPTINITPGLFDDNYKRSERYSVELNHDLPGSRLTSTTALTFADFSGLIAYDSDLMRALYGSPGEYWVIDQSKERVFSQDVRWSSLPNAPIQWTTGLNLSRADRSYNTPRNTYGTGSARYRDFATDKYAAYGEITYPLAEAWKLTGGLRQSWDKKTYDGRYVNGGAVTTDKRALDDTYTTGRVALSYAWTPSTNLYTMFSRGHKSGGFNDYAAQLADSAPYKPAVANALELGFKTESADRSLSLSGAVFLNKVKDDHLLGYDPISFASNAINANTRSQGAELEGTWRFDNGFSLSAGLSFIDAQIKTTVLGIGTGDVHAGNQVPDVARWSGNVALGYRQALPGFAGLATPILNTQLSLRMVGKRAADPQNNVDLGSYKKLDLRIGVASGNAEVYAWADNLLDERYDLYGFYSSPISYGAPSRGRALGVGYRQYF